MSTPYIGFSNTTLSKLLPAKAGDKITCADYGAVRVLIRPDDGSEFLLFYKCGEELYLGAINGHLIVGVKPDASGEI